MTNLPMPALRDTVQEFPPPDNTGIFWAQLTRGPILPPYGTKERDRILRIMHRNEFNGIWQGAVAGLIKRIKSTQWEIRPDIGLRDEAVHYEHMFQDAQFGMGWGVFLSRLLEDYLCQDYGAFVELIGPGDPTGPMMGPVEGIAHLDAGRTYVTGNPIYPVLYYSLMTGKLHKIHHTRIARITDMPNPDERYFNIGLCALSRAIAVCQREQRMGRYVDMRMDDKPKPGIALVSGMTSTQRVQAMQAYSREQQSDDRPDWGRVMWFHSINIDQPIDIKTLPFVETPEKFDFKVYTELDVNAVALALGVDRQELWELQGKAVGTSAQSQVLAQKSQGKAYADMLKTIERLINLTILPEGLEFKFRFKDAFADKAQAQIDAQAMQIAQGMASIEGAFSTKEIRNFLANKSDSFKDVLSNEQGLIGLPDDDRLAPDQQAQPLTETPPLGTNPDAAPPVPTQPAKVPTAPSKSVVKPRFAFQSKSFALTSRDWSDAFASAVEQAQKGAYAPRQLFALLLSELQDAGESAYLDGLREGGVDAPLSADEKGEVLDWLSTQQGYLQNFVNKVLNLPPDQIGTRAGMWARKSLAQMYSRGRLSANRNGMYKFVGTDGRKSCNTCRRLKGQVHRYGDWVKHQAVPGIHTESFECKGYQCYHKLVRTDEPEHGGF